MPLIFHELLNRRAKGCHPRGKVRHGDGGVSYGWETGQSLVN